MKTFWITFARTGIRNGWVRVQAHDEMIARAWASKEYGTCWSGIYGEKDWEPEFFPLGEFGATTLHYEDASHV